MTASGAPSRLRTWWQPLLALAMIAAGLVAWAWFGEATATRVWWIGLVIAGARPLLGTLRAVLRGNFATDVVATLAIIAALALQEPVAGLIVVLMQTGGEALERLAIGRASAAVRALEDAAPRIAHRMDGAQVTDLPVDAITVGDTLLVRPGELVPCDARVIRGTSTLDTSRLTGESDPRETGPGATLLSGMANRDGALVVQATALARESQYARIVELVRTAQERKAPLQRLADRYAGWFTPLTLLVCLLTWLVTHDASRVLAVLVVATPCPLILATPIAMIGGINRAATRRVIVRSGAAIERLAATRTVVLDKTGTLTVGTPAVAAVDVLPGFSRLEVLRLAGALEEHSGHPLARPLAALARLETGPLVAPSAVVESAGRGVRGVIDGRPVVVGSRSYVAEALSRAPEGLDNGASPGGGLQAIVAIDGRVAGIITYAETIRPSAGPLLQRLAGLGITRTVLLSGDHADHVRAIADSLGLREAIGELLPGDKVARIATLSAEAGPVMMVGDGTNDAPALSRADVGVAMAAHGGGITAESADAVLLAPDLERVADAIAIARRTMRIARQSILVGLGLSGVGMVAAALGYLTPIAGALAQEAIDVAVIVNALRASRGPD